MLECNVVVNKLVKGSFVIIVIGKGSLLSDTVGGAWVSSTCTVFCGGRECQRATSGNFGVSEISETPPGSRSSGFSELRVLGAPGSRISRFSELRLDLCHLHSRASQSVLLSQALPARRRGQILIKGRNMLLPYKVFLDTANTGKDSLWKGAFRKVRGV